MKEARTASAQPDCSKSVGCWIAHSLQCSNVILETLTECIDRASAARYRDQTKVRAGRSALPIHPSRGAVGLIHRQRKPNAAARAPTWLATRTIEAGLHLSSAGRETLRQERPNFLKSPFAFGDFQCVTSRSDTADLVCSSRANRSGFWADSA